MKKKIKKTAAKALQRFIDVFAGNGLMQEETHAEGARKITQGMPELCRQTAAEGIVMLKNDGTLPLDRDDCVSVFGRTQTDWFFVGHGSGGDVHAPYTVSFSDALKNAGVFYNAQLMDRYETWCSDPDHMKEEGWWGHWPFHHPEMPLDPETVREASLQGTAALVVIGRASGEDRDCRLVKGSYYLTDEETGMIRMVTDAFKHTVVILNIGNIIDLSWTEEFGDRISSLLIAWQGGMESGNALTDVLYGNVSPSGRLNDTIARSYKDYPSSLSFGRKRAAYYNEGIFVGYRYFEKFAPDRILYPFGYGLSYTEFSCEPLDFVCTEDKVSVSVRITNTGSFPAKETVQLWCRLPEGSLPGPVRVLCGFTKTGILQPAESVTAGISCSVKDYSSYDMRRSAFILEKGEYIFEVNGAYAGTDTRERTEVIEQCEPLYHAGRLLKQRIMDRMPDEIPVTGDRRYMLQDVSDGLISPETFIAQLSDTELDALTRGHGAMNSPLGTPGNAGVFGGIIQSLRDKGVPPVVTCDGPAGLRLQRYCSLLPSGNVIACTWNTELAQKLYEGVAREMEEAGIDILLGPGMNIHRDPLCGRNFEYFSEDPLLSGKTAAAVVRGIQSRGASACPKHYACNNQETNRNRHDSRVSERALREIYLRNFEICIKESSPLTIMSSYNKINGVWAHYHYDLCTTVLRGQWHYSGTVITDWWMRRAVSAEFPALRNNAYRIRSQVDVLMPGKMTHFKGGFRRDPQLHLSLRKEDGLTRAEMQRTAANVLRLVLRIKYRKEKEQ